MIHFFAACFSAYRHFFTHLPPVNSPVPAVDLPD